MIFNMIPIRCRKGNKVSGSFIVKKENYSPENWNKLLNGEELPCEWDEEGKPIAWDFMSNDDD